MSLELKVAICDDEKYYREYLQKFIMDYFENKNIKVVSSLFSNGSEFCEDKSNFQKYDIIFLDIEMDEMNGMDTAYMIRKFNLEVQIVFITIRVEYCLEGYKVDAMRFIVKEDLENSLQECLESVLQRMREKVVKMKFPFVGGERNIILANILYIESRSHQLHFHFVGKNEQLYLNKKLDVIEDKLRPYYFARTHQSFLVNLQYVEKIASYKVHLSNGVVLSAVKGRYNELKSMYLQYKERI